MQHRINKDKSLSKVR